MTTLYHGLIVGIGIGLGIVGSAVLIGSALFMLAWGLTSLDWWLNRPGGDADHD